MKRNILTMLLLTLCLWTYGTTDAAYAYTKTEYDNQITRLSGRAQGDESPSVYDILTFSSSSNEKRNIQSVQWETDNPFTFANFADVKRNKNMKTDSINNITLETLNEYTDLVVYTSENVTILNDISKIIRKNRHVAKLGCMMMVFCEGGEATLHINGNPCLLQKGNCAILAPGTVIQSYTPAPDWATKIFTVSQNFLTETLSLKKETWDILHYLYHHPIFPINRDTTYKMYLYKELLLALIQEKPHAYSQRTRSFHFSGMLCEMFAMLNELIPDNERQSIQINRGALITRDFINLVNADNGTHRSVSYYADRLCYSPKYLCAIIKETTGKTPMQFIQKNTIKQIKYKLKHSDMSIKEVADAFDFPNPSFFGKFVKAQTGMTPLECRMSKEEKS